MNRFDKYNTLAKVVFIFSIFLFLYGCAPLPKFKKIAAHAKPVGQPAIADATGPLSKQESASMFKALRDKTAGNGILDRHLGLMASLTGARLFAGNRMTLLQDGKDTFSAMIEAIENATDHVNMETYIFESGATGVLFSDLLIKKQEAGVQVNLIYDGVGSILTHDSFFKRMERKGIRVLKYHPVTPLYGVRRWSIGKRDHRKLLIVDGKIAFTGGINISGVYSKWPGAGRDDGSSWRDTHVQVEGPVVAELQKLFVDTWTAEPHPDLPKRNYFPPLENAGGCLVKVVAGSHEQKTNHIYATMLSAISHSRQSVHITAAYFAPGRHICNALTDAAKRGVDVKLILPSHSDTNIVFHAGRGYYTRLLKAGVRIFELEGTVLHSKTAVIDGIWSTVGSANMDYLSFKHNNEANVVMLDPDFAKEMETVFAADMAGSTEILLEKWKKRPIPVKLRELGAGLLRYWL